MDLEVGQILTQIVAFLIMLWILKKVAWKPVFEIMEQRRRLIQSEFDAIEEQKKEVKKLSDEYQEKLKHIEDQARIKIHEAINEGREISQDILEQTHQRTKEMLHKAQQEVKREIVKAKMQLKNDLVAMTIAATQKLIGGELDAQKQKKLISEFMEQMEFKE